MLVDERWTVKVADFGHSVHMGAGQTSRIGTIFWTAPEVMQGESNTPASDVYGCVPGVVPLAMRREIGARRPNASNPMGPARRGGGGIPSRDGLRVSSSLRAGVYRSWVP